MRFVPVSPSGVSWELPLQVHMCYSYSDFLVFICFASLALQGLKCALTRGAVLRYRPQGLLQMSPWKGHVMLEPFFLEHCTIISCPRHVSISLFLTRIT